MNHVYGKRNNLKIKVKSIFHYYFDYISWHYRYKESGLIYKDISLYKCNNSKELSNAINILCWYFPEKIFKDKRPQIFVKNEKVLFDANLIDKCYESFVFPDVLEGFEILLQKGFKQQLGNRLLLVNSIKHLLNIRSSKNLARIRIVDKNYFSHVESSNLQSILFETLDSNQKKNLSDLTKSNFIRLTNFIKETNFESSSCFVTGPSFDTYTDFDFVNLNTFKIVCNSIVKNANFMEYIGGVHLLTFADSVFHFGPSKYAAEFRKNVIQSFNKHKFFIVVPENVVALLLSHYPEIEDYIIGIPYVNNRDFNFPEENQFWVKDNGNILSNYMVPLASIASDTIYIFGADGRSPDEKYFWKHSANAQFNSLMNTVFESHPSFFRDRSYVDYYQAHCDSLEGLIQFGERKGKKYFALTESYIPALKNRKLANISFKNGNIN